VITTNRNRVPLRNFIFAEFCYQLFKDKEKNPEELSSEIESAIVKIMPKIIKMAMRFRYENKQKNMSMVDCISYFQAKELDIKFLTGDKEFEGMENVEFVK